MKIIIGVNEKFGRGYQVRVVDNGEVIDFNPYTLGKAVLMAEKALNILNKREGTEIGLRDALEIDRGSVLANREYDGLSRKMAEKIEGGDGIETGFGEDDYVADTGT